MTYCRRCGKILTFISDKKKKYVYCKVCYSIMVQSGLPKCQCGGFRPLCGGFPPNGCVSWCKNFAEHCDYCKTHWRYEYCWTCQ